MLRDITIGRYIKKDSPIHRLDGRVKIIGALVYSIAILSCSSFFQFAVAVLFTAFAILISKLPFSYILKGLKPLRWFILFTAVVNIIAAGGTPILSLGTFRITYEGLSAALILALRFVLFVFGTSLLTLTTAPIDITDSLARLMTPLRKLKIPTDDIAMMISVTLRFIPLFADESERIIKAQKARGADFSSGSIISRIRAIIPLTIPLFVGVIRKSDELALSMESRCYGKGARIPRKKAILQKNDFVFGLIMTFFCGILVIIEFFN